MLEFRRGELQAFDGREHRDGRRDHRVADEHRRADHAENHERDRAAPERSLPQRHQRQRSALAVIVGAQQQQHVLNCHHDNERPQDQRQHTEDDRAADLTMAGRIRDGFTEGVERRRADVAIDDANATQRQSPERLL